MSIKPSLAGLAGWALAYIALSFELQFDGDRSPFFGDFLFGTEIILAPGIFMPLLAAWLGARHGRRALLPVLIAAPLTAWRIEFQVTDDSSLIFGAGATITAAAIVATLIFAAFRDRPDRLAASPRLGPGLILDIAVLAILLLSARIDFTLGRFDAEAMIGGYELSLLAAFGLVASGRRSVSLTAAIVAALAIGVWAVDTFTPAPLVYHSDIVFTDYGSFFWSAGASEDVFPTLWLILPAAFAGLAVRRLVAGSSRPANPALAACLLLLALPALLAPVKTWSTEFPLPGASQTMAAADAAPTVARLVRQPVEPIVVITTPSREPTFPFSHVFLILLGAAAFVIGASTSSRARTFLAPLLQLAALSIFLLEDAVYALLDGYPPELIDTLIRHSDVIVAIGAVAWMFAWLGARRSSASRGVAPS